jgi:Zn-dependent peptidase ImmA (M78 family)
VQKSHPFTRQRFTVAHELGHFVLHSSYINPDTGIQDDEFYRALSGPLETQANQFAADVLMPWRLINQLQGLGTKDLSSLASKLVVSKQALAIRLGLPYDQTWE